MIPKFRVFADEKIREVYAIKWNEDGCFVMVDYGGGLAKTFPVDEVKLMQSTGLFDKNGKEIYEGDIIKYSGNSRYWTVYWNEVVGQFRFKCYGFVSKSYGDYAFHSVLEYRIVGNIHENPELINQ